MLQAKRIVCLVFSPDLNHIWHVRLTTYALHGIYVTELERIHVPVASPHLGNW